MNIEQLFKGIAIIIDDEINDRNSAIYKIKSKIEARNIPVLTYDNIPNKELIDSFEHSSFIVLDWDYKSDTERDIQNVPERISMPSARENEKEVELIEFIKEILKLFIPLFIFTSQSVEQINDIVYEQILSGENDNRIFIKHKSELTSDDVLFKSIEDWLKQVPSVYVLKSWERTIVNAKNKMFIEMYKYSPNWTKIIWDCLNKDSIENENEFGEFVTRNLINRISKYEFEEDILDCGNTVSKEELAAVIEGERYISYETQPEQAYTGDIFKENSKYYLNIRAQCDLSRPAEDGTYNPELYCIEGKKLRSQDILKDDIHFTTEKDLVFKANKRFSLGTIESMCEDETQIDKLNKLFRKNKYNIFFSKGEILEKKPEVIVACIADEKAIRFDLNKICIKSFNDIKDKRIGRLLPPHITRVQQKCSQYIVREGVMPIPISLFEDFE